MDSREDADPEPGALSSLRRAAFAPGGTDSDLAAWRDAVERERPRRTPAAPDGDPLASPGPSPSSAPAAPASAIAIQGVAPARRASRAPRVAVAALTAATLLATGGVMGGALTRDDRPRAGLGIFQEPADPSDPTSLWASQISGGGPDGVLPEDRVRWLRVLPEGNLFAALGTVFRRGGSEVHLAICLVMEREGSGLTKCSTIDEFAASGIRIRSGDLDVSWGPTDAPPVVRDRGGIPV